MLPVTSIFIAPPCARQSIPWTTELGALCSLITSACSVPRPLRPVRSRPKCRACSSRSLIDEAAGRYVDVRISEDRVLLDWRLTRHLSATPIGSRSSLATALRVLCLAEDREPADSVEGLANLEVSLGGRDDLYEEEPAIRRERRIAAERDASDVNGISK